MPIDKREIPLRILKLLEPYLKEESNVYKLSAPKKGVILEIIENHPDPKFFFRITSWTTNNKVRIEQRPGSVSSPYQNNYEGVVDNLKTYVDSWINLLGSYNDINFLDDPILSQYYDEFMNEFVNLNEDAETKTYDLKTQMLLDQFLDNSIRLIAESNEIGKDDSEELISDIQELKQNQTRLTKKKIVEKIGLIVSKVRKTSFPAFKSIMTMLFNESLKIGLTKGIELLIETVK